MVYGNVPLFLFHVLVSNWPTHFLEMEITSNHVGGRYELSELDFSQDVVFFLYFRLIFSVKYFEYNDMSSK